MEAGDATVSPLYELGQILNPSLCVHLSALLLRVETLVLIRMRKYISVNVKVNYI